MPRVFVGRGFRGVTQAASVPPLTATLSPAAAAFLLAGYPPTAQTAGGGNAWDPPTPDTIVNVSLSQSALLAAISAAVAGDITQINLPASGSANWSNTSAIDISGKKIIIDHNACIWNRTGTGIYSFRATYSWKSECSAVTTVSGKTRVTKLSGNWSSMSPAPAAGDKIKMFCNGAFRGDISNGRRHGEHVIVESVSGNNMTFTTRLTFNEDTASNRGGNPWTSANRPFAALFPRDTGLWLVDPTIVGPDGSTTTKSLIALTSLAEGAVIRSTARDCGNNIGIMTDCSGIYWIDPNHKDANVSSGAGVGIQQQHCGKNTIKRVDGAQPLMSNVEDIADENAFSPGTTSQGVSLPDVSRFGFGIGNRVEYIEIDPSLGFGNVIASHSGSWGLTHHGCYGESPAVGSRPAITLRGKLRSVTADALDPTKKIIAPAGIQFLCYAADQTTWGGTGGVGGLPSYYHYRDASDATFRKVWFRILGGGSGAVFFNNTGSQADNVNAAFFNTLFEEVNWDLQGGTSCQFNWTPCGDVEIIGGTVFVNSAVGIVHDLDRPSSVTVFDAGDTDLTFDDQIIDLAGHPNSGTLTLVDISNNCVARGTLLYRNKPPGLTLNGSNGKVTSGSGDGSGLVITAI